MKTIKNEIFKIAVCIALVALASCSKEKKSQDSAAAQDSTGMSSRIITSDKIKIGEGNSTAVISGAQKFIIPVPKFKNAEPLVFPQDNPKAGQQITDYEGKLIGKSGIVFFNYKDKSVQAAPNNGEAVIIINEVNEEQAGKLDSEIKKLKANPNDLSLAELKQILAFSHEKLDLSDMYNSTRSYVKGKMTPVFSNQKSSNSDEAYGFKKRDDRDINQAVYIKGAFTFKGPAASPQQFENGGVIVEQGGKMRGVQPDIFVRTYKLADGSAVDSSLVQIKSQNP